MVTFTFTHKETGKKERIESPKLFKFRSGNELDVQSLQEQYLWFAKADTLNDPYEGLLHYDTTGLTDELLQRFLETYSKGSITDLKTVINEIMNTLGILSLSVQGENKQNDPYPITSPMMWSHYANGLRGFCIEFDQQKLCRSLLTLSQQNPTIKLVNTVPLAMKYATKVDKSLPNLNLARVMSLYLEDPDSAASEIVRAFDQKDEYWEAENEIRLLSSSSGKTFYEPNSINAIYIGERADCNLKLQLQEFVTQMNRFSENHIQLLEVELKDKEYGFRYIPINFEARKNRGDYYSNGTGGYVTSHFDVESISLSFKW